MRVGGLISIATALALGAVAVAAVRGRLAETPAAAPAVAAVVVAKVPLPFGGRIAREQLELVPWPADHLPTGAFTTIEQVVESGGDRVAMRPIAANEPLLVDKVSSPGGRATLSTIVGVEMRAVTIRVNDVLGVAGFVLPGDRVDILLTRGTPGQEDGTTDLLLQNVRVLGIDQEASEKKDKPQVARAVTLEVRPDEAQKLTLAGSVGTLSLALRNAFDGEPGTARTVRLIDLKSTAPAEAPRRGGGIVILRGMKSETVTIRGGE